MVLKCLQIFMFYCFQWMKIFPLLSQSAIFNMYDLPGRGVMEISADLCKKKKQNNQNQIITLQ